jgi:hypothetical protein
VNRSATERGRWLPLIVMVDSFEVVSCAEFESLVTDGPHVVVLTDGGRTKLKESR